MDKALLHVLTRSAPYVQAQLVKMEEVVGEEKVQYNVPAELHEYLFRYSWTSGQWTDSRNVGLGIGDKKKKRLIRDQDQEIFLQF